MSEPGGRGPDTRGPDGRVFLTAAAVLLGTLLTVVAMPALITSRSGPAVAVTGSAGEDTRPDQPRVVLWGDSLAWEAQEFFTRAVTGAGATVLTRTFGGTAACDWLTDVEVQLARWRPTAAVLAFSGNTVSACMRGREPMSAYRADVSAVLDALTAAGVTGYLVDAPARPDQSVDADGLTPLAQLWRELAAGRPDVAVIPAALAVTAGGHWARYLPCAPGEPCEPTSAGSTGRSGGTEAPGGTTGIVRTGQVMVRGPDGVHFCPVTTAPMHPCRVRSVGAERYGAAMAAPLVTGTREDVRDRRVR